MTQQFAKFEKMSCGTTSSKKVVQDINLQRSCIKAQLKKLHNFNPNESCQISKQIVMELQFPKKLSGMPICK